MNLARFGPPTSAYVGHFFVIFCLLKADLILKSFWHRFSFDFGPILNTVLGSNLGPRRASNLKRPMCTKCYYLQYETIVFAIPRGLKIDEKSMPKRLQDKIGFQEAKNHAKVPNIRSSWSPRSSQLASKIEVKNEVYLKSPKTRGQVNQVK